MAAAAATVWESAYVGLGSNLEDPAAQLSAGAAALRDLPDTRLVLESPRYRSRPIGLPGQPDYLNAAVGLLTRLPARALLQQLHAIERRRGRRRGEERWGPRTLDLDLLVYGRLCVAGPDLSVPHPRMGERNFVLWPLADIAPMLQVPGLGRVDRLAAALGTAGLERVAGD